MELELVCTGFQRENVFLKISSGFDIQLNAQAIHGKVEV